MELCHRKNDSEDISKKKKRKRAVLGLRAYPAQFMMMSAIMLNMWCLPLPYYDYKPFMIRFWPIFGTLLPRYKYRRKGNSSVNIQKDLRQAEKTSIWQQRPALGNKDLRQAEKTSIWQKRPAFDDKDLRQAGKTSIWQ